MTKPKCLMADCQMPRKSRGLCPACYWTARNMIRKGRVTDEELVQNKLMLEARNAHRAKTPMAVAINKLFKKKIVDTFVKLNTKK